MPDVPIPAPTCPLCGGPNGCAAVAAGTFDVVCWCAQQAFPPSLVQRLPEAARGQACICRRCAQAEAPNAAAPAGAPAS